MDLKGITYELAARANEVARCFCPDYYCSVHEVAAMLPPKDDYAGGPYTTRAIRVWTERPERTLLLYIDTAGTEEELLVELAEELRIWQAGGSSCDAYLTVEPDAADSLARLATHPLTSNADRTDLLGKLVPRLTRQQAREINADLTAKIEARAPGTLARRSWTPYGVSTLKPAPHPFALNQ
jgi:hypothetical protein